MGHVSADGQIPTSCVLFSPLSRALCELTMEYWGPKTEKCLPKTPRRGPVSVSYNGRFTSPAALQLCLDFCTNGTMPLIGTHAHTTDPMQNAKGFQHHRMTNGAMNVEIGNPAYKIYEGEPDDDAGELLDSDFALDPDKPTNFTNPVYATLYMGAHNSRNSLASTDEKKELLSQGDDGEDEDMSDPLA
ncbi:hypothetical protein J4Q44_G00256830 [Coregonus suidteri]|uniref:Uncharacterized protein n=1 Tax=Coregonus suidteri TaxID=861788 RepID=A0AAN8QF11_9TELE